MAGNACAWSSQYPHRPIPPDQPRSVYRSSGSRRASTCSSQNFPCPRTCTSITHLASCQSRNPPTISSDESFVWTLPSIHISSNVEIFRCFMSSKSSERVAKYADMFSAMGTEPRLRIMQLLLAAHPEGMVVGDIQSELDIPNSTLSHHLEKLKTEGLVEVQREGTFLRCTANTAALQELLQFLYAECCTRNKAVKPQPNRSNLQAGD